MKKVECSSFIEALAKFLVKNKNMYSQNMSKKLKEKWDSFSICCSNEKVQVEVIFKIIK